MKNGQPPFDPALPWLVACGPIVEGTDCREFRQCCCEPAARDHAAYLRRCGCLDVTVERQHPIPQRGLGGNWRVSPGARAPHRCDLVPADPTAEQWGGVAALERLGVTVV